MSSKILSPKEKLELYGVKQLNLKVPEVQHHEPHKREEVLLTYLANYCYNAIFFRLIPCNRVPRLIFPTLVWPLVCGWKEVEKLREHIITFIKSAKMSTEANIPITSYGMRNTMKVNHMLKIKFFNMWRILKFFYKEWSEPSSKTCQPPQTLNQVS